MAFKKNENNIESFAGVESRGWGGKGVKVDKAMTSHEAIKLAQLDYEVGIKPLHANIDNEWQKVEANATYNKSNGDIFGVVGTRYEVVQNQKAFEFMDGIVGSKQAIFDRVGAMGRGETIFISAKLPNNIRMQSLPNEEIENYLLFTSSHDGSGSIRVLLTPVRIVCDNALPAAYNNGKALATMKHTKNVSNRLNEIQKMFINLNTSISIIGEKLDRLNGITYTDVQIDTFLAKLILPKDAYVIEDDKAMATKEVSNRHLNLIYQLKKSIYTGVGQDIINPNTGYGIYNGVTNYLQNSKVYKKADDKFAHIFTKQNIGNKAFNILMDDVLI